MVTKSTEQLTLALVLKNIVMPWIARDGMEKVFTACPEWQPEMELPEGMTVTRKPLLGKRIAVRGGRPIGAAAVIDANWPQDNLLSARTPKLCFILTGPVTFQVSDYVLLCRPGHGILLPPGIPFANGAYNYGGPSEQHPNAYEMLQMMPYQGGLICWISRGQEDAQGKIHQTESICSVPHSKVPFHLHQLVDEALKKDLHEHLVCDCLLNLTIALLHREIQQLPVLQTGKTLAADSPALTGQKHYSIKQAQEYIESNLREPLSVDMVARYVCMSRTIFTEQFHARTGKTFTAYIQDLRLEEARKLLKETDLAVRQISAAVGYKPGRMRALFHQREKMSPLQFRCSSRRQADMDGV